MVELVAAIASPTFADVPVASALTVALLVPVALIDTHTRHLPDVWIGAAAVVFLVADALERAVGTAAVPPGQIVLGALIMGVPLLLMHLASPSSMGFGDVKLAVVLGAAVGATDWNLALPTLALAAGATATVGVIGRARSVPFGPGLVGATLVALLAHDVLIRA
ncbi:MAG: prepilin peptidase [Ilumatobacteraceae bacterium]